MDLVILAAGKGTRLRPYTEKRPKPMVTVGGISILEHTIRNAEDFFDRVIVVTGYKAEEIEDFLEGFEVDLELLSVFNQDFGDSGPAKSLQRGFDLVEGDFVVVNGDTVYSSKVFDEAVSGNVGLTVVGGLRENLEEDAMKLELDEGRICKVSKDVDSEHVSSGAIAVKGEEAKEIICDACKKFVEDEEFYYWHEALNYSRENRVLAEFVEVDFVQWFEVDTPEDLYNLMKKDPDFLN